MTETTEEKTDSQDDLNRIMQPLRSDAVWREPELPTIFQLIPEVMKKVGPVKKAAGGRDQNGDGVPYKFRGIDQVMNALHPALTAAGVFIVPTVLDYKSERLNNGRAHQVILTVAYDFYGPRGDSFRAVGIGESVDYGDKATNQAMSMAFKYALLETFCIPTEDMEDGDAKQVTVENAERSARPAPSNGRPRVQKPAKSANPETGEVLEPITSVVNKLSPEAKEKLEAKMKGYPPLDQLPPAAEKQVRKWVEEFA